MKLVTGRTNDDLCPVRHSNVIISISSWQCSWSSLLLGHHTPPSKPKFVDHVCHALLVANVPVHLYTAHSFHIGAATTAISASIKDSTIQSLECWKSLAYLLYIRLNPSHLVNMSTTMAQCPIYLLLVCLVI